jgi:hypothetical protein
MNDLRFLFPPSLGLCLQTVYLVPAAVVSMNLFVLSLF